MKSEKYRLKVLKPAIYISLPILRMGVPARCHFILACLLSPRFVRKSMHPLLCHFQRPGATVFGAKVRTKDAALLLDEMLRFAESVMTNIPKG